MSIKLKLGLIIILAIINSLAICLDNLVIDIIGFICLIMLMMGTMDHVLNKYLFDGKK